MHYGGNSWGMTRYPLVPGHESTGTVSAIGAAVTKFAVGALRAAGRTARRSARRTDDRQCLHWRSPTSWLAPGVPHDSYLSDFLMRSKAVIRD